MIARRLSLLGVALSLLLPGCVVEKRDFEALRDQVRLQQKQINDLKARQEEQGLRVDTLNNGFKILGAKAEENARRIDDLGERDAQPAPQAAAPAPARSRGCAQRRKRTTPRLPRPRRAPVEGRYSSRICPRPPLPSRHRAGRSSPPVPRRRSSTPARSPCIPAATTSRRPPSSRSLSPTIPITSSRATRSTGSENAITPRSGLPRLRRSSPRSRKPTRQATRCLPPCSRRGSRSRNSRGCPRPRRRCSGSSNGMGSRKRRRRPKRSWSAGSSRSRSIHPHCGSEGHKR